MDQTNADSDSGKVKWSFFEYKSFFKPQALTK